MRVVSKILIIAVISTLLLSGCLPLNYYPAKISEPNEQYVGFAVGANAWYSNPYDGEVQPASTVLLYNRINLTRNMDVGFELGLPYFTASLRKGFFYQDNHHLLILDGGFGISLFTQPLSRLSTTFVVHPVYILLGVNKSSYPSVLFAEGNGVNTVYAKISFENKQIGRFIPFMYVAYTTFDEETNSFFNYRSFFSKYDNEFDYDIRRRVTIGLAWNFNFHF